MSEFTSEVQRAFDREALRNGYRKANSSQRMVYFKGMAGERRHLLELQPGQILYGVLYKHGQSWAEDAEGDFERYSPEDCHYRKSIAFSGLNELETVLALIEKDLAARLNVSKSADFREWKAAERAFRKWVTRTARGNGVKKCRTRRSRPLAGGLMMRRQEQKSLYCRSSLPSSSKCASPRAPWRQ
jgi:hypothetical protein